MEHEYEFLVSIITPSFNSEEFISSTIESVINQSYTKWELIIIDDCSSDKTINLIEESIKKDERIKLFVNEYNSGAGHSRNRGIEMSNGRFIAFLDSDDLWHRNKLEIQVDFMLKKNIPISFTSYKLINENGKELNKTIKSIPKVDYRGVLKNTIIGMSTSMIDTRIVGRDFRLINLRTRQDLYLWITLLKQGYTAFGIKSVLTSYRVRTNSISSNKVDGAKKVWYLYYHVEKLGLFKSIYYFIFYAFNAIKKRIIS